MEVKDRIEDSIVVFEKNTFPSQLSDILSDNKLVIFGETHYVQEHQEFIVSILPYLSFQGYTVIFQELFHGFNWMVEDYINGELNNLPEVILYFDATLIEGIKAFNATVDEDQKISLIYMDMNHWQSNFLKSVEEIEKNLGPVELFSNIKNVNPNKAKDQLEEILVLMKDQEARYKLEFGLRWYQRIIDMIEAEILSVDYRNQRNGSDREQFMVNNITSFLETHPGQKGMINTGMFHGQKKTYMGEPIKRLGQILKDQNLSMFSIAFIGLKGTTKSTFDATEKISFDLIQNASNDDIILILDELSSPNLSFLPLRHQSYEKDVTISFTSQTTISAPIGQQFDGIITYPEISILKSMDIYDWRK